MKKFLWFPMISLVFLSIAVSGCLKDECEAEHFYVKYDPVFILPANLRTTIQLEPVKQIEQPGKIYVYGQYLFVNEYEEGIHVFDNENPSNPVALGFLPIPGNIDMAVRNNLLYADSYVDLVTFRLDNPAKPEMVSRLENVFPHMGFDANRGFLVKYEPSEVVERISCSQATGDQVWLEGGLWVRKDVAVLSGSGNSVPGNTTGIGGSTARFTLGREHLYTVSETDLKVFDLKVPEKPNLANTVHIGWGIETIYPYDDKLFIGSRNGMFIYDTKDPLNPRQLANFAHANACDPVVVEGNYAYITLRDGTKCESFTNQLEVVDVTNILKPNLLKTYPMHHPIGLSIVNGILFICEDDEGLKVFDASDWDKIDQRLLDHEKGLTTFDVIALEKEKVAIVTGKEGIYQYDFTNPKDLKLLSKIKIETK
ncbi:MAG: hypothetical protein IPN74_04185 [Haliscomenobacter sp.]|nr:hypothetical protein [Haliscomenobacter sp.]